MEYRKLISFGKNSFIISLPKDWIKKNKLKKGDTVYVKKRGENITISPKDQEKKSEEIRAIIINTKDKTFDLIQVEIMSSYLAGYSVMEIRGDSIVKEAPKIKSVLKELVGIELIEETSNKIVAKDLIDIEEISIKVLIRRTDLLLRGMISDMINNTSEENYVSIYERDKDVNRLVFLTKRVLRFTSDNEKIRNMYNMRVIDITRSWRVIGYMESIGDHIKRTSRILTRTKTNPKMKKNLNTLLLMLEKRYIDIMKAYHTKDLNIALKIERESKKRLKMIEEFEKKYPSSYRMTYNMKAMTSAIKHIGRAVINTNI